MLGETRDEQSSRWTSRWTELVDRGAPGWSAPTMAPLLQPLVLLVIVHDDNEDGKWIATECGKRSYSSAAAAAAADS
jgi:hypothetical protein